MKLKLIKHFGKKKAPQPYQNFLIFDADEGHAVLTKAHKRKSELTRFLHDLIKERKKYGLNDYRLEHALSASLEELGLKKIAPGTLESVLTKILNNPAKKTEFRKWFLVSTPHITYQGRHLQLDQFIKKFFYDQPINFLDIGCCPAVHGAVTTDDTYHVLSDAQITAVDLFYPKNFAPYNDQIKYLKGNILEISLPKAHFDVIRCVNVELFFTRLAQAKLRAYLLQSLKEEGLYINGREAKGYSIYQLTTKK